MKPRWITAIESHIGMPIVGELQEFYLRGDGERNPEDGGPLPSSDDRPMRLMTSAEVIRTFDRLGVWAKLRDSCPFWIGWNREYAAVYLEGPLKGRVYFWRYDDRHTSVAYRGVGSLMESMRKAAEDGADWYEMRTDYYVDTDYFLHGPAVCKPATKAAVESDDQARQHLRAEYATATIENELDEHHFAFNIMGLTPLASTYDIVGFLDAEDMWVQARACDILGNRRFQPAVQRLGEVARNEHGNGHCAALIALGKIGTPVSLEEILRSVPYFDRGHYGLIANALQHCGCRVRWQDDKFRVRHYEYQLPNTDQWRQFD